MLVNSDAQQLAVRPEARNPSVSSFTLRDPGKPNVRRRGILPTTRGFLYNQKAKCAAQIRLFAHIKEQEKNETVFDKENFTSILHPDHRIRLLFTSTYFE
jgi:hypothetical protein